MAFPLCYDVMIPVVNITFFIRLAIRTLFSAFFSRASAITFAGVILSGFTAFGLSYLLGNLDSFLSDILPSDGAGFMTNNPLIAIIWDWLKFDMVIDGFTFLFGFASTILAAIPTFLGLVFSGLMVYGGVASIRNFIIGFVDITKWFKQFE